MRFALVCSLALLFTIIESPSEGDAQSNSPGPRFGRSEARQLRNEVMEKDYATQLEALRKLNPPLSLENQEKQAFLLDRLSSLYRQGERMSEAEQALRDLLPLYEELARFKPDRYQKEITKTYMNLGGILRDTGRLEEATSSYQVALSRLKANNVPIDDEDKSDLALALNNLANLFRQANRMGEAERNYLEAITLRRELAMTGSIPYKELAQVDLAASLNSLGNLLSETRRFLDAESSYKESLSIRYQMRKPGRSGEVDSGIVTTLGNLANVFDDIGRADEAEKTYIQSFELAKELLKQDRAGHLRDFAQSSTDYVKFLNRTNQEDKSVDPAWESITAWQELYRKSPSQYAQDFIEAMIRSAHVLSVHGKKAEIEPLLKEAIRVARQLRQRNLRANSDLLAQILLTSAHVSYDARDPSYCADLQEASVVGLDASSRLMMEPLLTRCATGSPFGSPSTQY